MTSNDVLFLEGVRTDFCDKRTTIRDLLVPLLIDRDAEERVCAIFDQSKLTMGHLSDRARRVAVSLIPYDFVAICMKPSFELIVTLCGIILRGIPYVPIEPSLPLERVKYILEDSQVQLVIVDNVSLLENIIKTVTCSQLCIDVTDPEINKTIEVNREDTFCVMYTSGSTGQPKGVQLPHRALINRLYWQWSYFPFNEEDVCCLKTSISFVDSVVEIFSPLIRRIPMIIIPKVILLDIDRFISVLSTQRISYIVLVPSLLTFLFSHLKNNNSSLSALRLIVSSGETLSQTLIESFFALKQCFSPTCRLINLYGSTEVMADVTCEIYEVINHLYHMSLDGRTSIGYPIANMRVDIVEPDEQGIGELVVTGEGVANGYHNVDAKNTILSNKFVRSNDGRLRFHSGDLGKIWNNRIIFYGRHDNQIKIAGNRIDLSEIEFILKQHFNCRQPIAVYVATNEQIVVFLQSSEEVAGLDRESLSNYVPLYAVPTRFVTIADFPLLIWGKIDRQQLINSLDMAKETTELECNLKEGSVINRAFYSALAEIGVPYAHANRNFFSAGGSSLNALSLLTKLHRLGFHDLTVERLMSTESLQDILLHHIVDSNRQYHDLYFECHSEYQVVSLEHVEKCEAQRIITESFVNHSEFDVIVHHNRADLKLVCTREWYTLLDALWPYYVTAGLSFGISDDSGQLVGVSLSNDEADDPHMDLSSVPLLAPSYNMLDVVRNDLLEELRCNNALRQPILHALLMAVNPDIKPERRLTIMYIMEREVLRLATAKRFAAVITENTNNASHQFAKSVFKYDINRVVRANQWRDSSGTLPFSNAQDNHIFTVSMKFLDK